MTIGIDEPHCIERKLAEAATFGILKIKVGTHRDHDTLNLVRRHAPGKRLRLDANGAWTVGEAIKRIDGLARFEPDCIEQPIPAGHHDALRQLHRASPIPIVADEDCARPGDVARLAGCCAGVNVKLAKCGGIRQALRMIETARAMGLRVMLGCMVETSLGIAAAAAVASRADDVDLDGHLLLADEPFGGLTLDGDRVVPSDAAGFGIDASPMFAENGA